MAKPVPKGTEYAKETFRILCGSVRSEYSLAVLRRIEETSDWSHAFKSVMPNPVEYTTARAFALDYGVHTYLKKYVGGADEQLLRASTVESYLAVEARNRETNSRVNVVPLNGGVDAIIMMAARKIQRILGEFCYSEFLECCEWGSGATASIKRHEASVDNKVNERSLSVTRSCLDYARAWLESDYHWLASRLGMDVDGPASLMCNEFDIIEYGVFDTVPKDNKSLRTIDKQPTLNLFFQKGVGRMMRRKLRMCGVNLDDQSRNQLLASRAHAQNLATLDLANASNTVTTSLVRACFQFCPDWLRVLTDLRTKFVKIDGRLKYLEMFSAMGNGYTFELESLIFYALCWAVKAEAGSECVVSVYGDDLIIGQDIADRVIHVLTQCGFEVNDQKSYTSGPFYESCGRHFFNGIEVTPLYQKEEITTPLAGIRAANRLLRWSARLGRSNALDSRVYPAWEYLAGVSRQLHDACENVRLRRLQRMRKRRPRGSPSPLPTQPYWLDGDGALIDPYGTFVPDKHGTIRLDVYRETSIKTAGDPRALLATSLRRSAVGDSPFLWLTTEDGFNGCVTIKGRTRTIRQLQRCSAEYHDVPIWTVLNHD